MPGIATENSFRCFRGYLSGYMFSSPWRLFCHSWIDVLLPLYLTCSVIQLVGTAFKEPVFKCSSGQLHWAIGQFDYVLFEELAKSWMYFHFMQWNPLFKENDYQEMQGLLLHLVLRVVFCSCQGFSVAISLFFFLLLMGWYILNRNRKF
jgi:hypothetical protein